MMLKKALKLPPLVYLVSNSLHCRIVSNTKTKVEICCRHGYGKWIYRRRFCNYTAIKSRVTSGPPLKYFIEKTQVQSEPQTLKCEQLASHEIENSVSSSPSKNESDRILHGGNRKVFIETYGCQMNVSDTEVALSVLIANGFKRTSLIEDADVILVMTCSIREGAEDKIWKRLEYYKLLKSKRNKFTGKPPIKIGILGCMAERLKTKILEREKMVDLLCGPDAYRDLPRLLAITESSQSAANVQLSLEETYADISPVRLNAESTSAFVSIMRGCDNMCSYCIVPFTRGRERSRPISSIRNEVVLLANQGVKEVVLLGQNVNSFRDLSETNFVGNKKSALSSGFTSIYKPKLGGLRFVDLLDKVSYDNPEMRIRFTSPHPKDFPDEVLYLIRERPNLGKQIHLPAQSGNNLVLDAMRRGYTRKAYLELVEHIRDIIPGVSLSSDFIAGFCEETEEAHQDSLSLLEIVKFNFCFCFPYSMREKTKAFHHLVDNVEQAIKKRRAAELVTTFRQICSQIHQSQIGEEQLVLVEGDSKRSRNEVVGRNDGNTKVIFPKASVPSGFSQSDVQPIKAGNFVVVKITGCTSQVLKGVAQTHSSITEFSRESVAQHMASKL